jgi:hypothetical protein
MTLGAWWETDLFISADIKIPRLDRLSGEIEACSTTSVEKYKTLSEKLRSWSKYWACA